MFATSKLIFDTSNLGIKPFPLPRWAAYEIAIKNQGIFYQLLTYHMGNAVETHSKDEAIEVLSLLPWLVHHILSASLTSRLMKLRKDT